jgi:outer membrane protein
VENAAFGSQWRQNMNKYIQLSLSVPLFNRFQIRNRVKSARIQQSTLAWQLEESQKTLYKEIQQAYYNALASESKYKSSQSAIQTAEASFQLTSEKYANGKASATEYNEMRTVWMKALSEGIQAKYDFVYRSKILDFYKGIPLTL